MSLAQTRHTPLPATKPYIMDIPIPDLASDICHKLTSLMAYKTEQNTLEAHVNETIARQAALQLEDEQLQDQFRCHRRELEFLEAERIRIRQSALDVDSPLQLHVVEALLQAMEAIGDDERRVNSEMESVLEQVLAIQVEEERMRVRFAEQSRAVLDAGMQFINTAQGILATISDVRPDQSLSDLSH